MLYNIPSRTGQELLLEAITPLAEHPNLWALKEASGVGGKNSESTTNNYPM